MLQNEMKSGVCSFWWWKYRLTQWKYLPRKKQQNASPSYLTTVFHFVSLYSSHKTPLNCTKMIRDQSHLLLNALSGRLVRSNGMHKCPGPFTEPTSTRNVKWFLTLLTGALSMRALRWKDGSPFNTLIFELSHGPLTPASILPKCFVCVCLSSFITACVEVCKSMHLCKELGLINFGCLSNQRPSSAGKLTFPECCRWKPPWEILTVYNTD